MGKQARSSKLMVRRKRAPAVPASSLDRGIVGDAVVLLSFPLLEIVAPGLATVVERTGDAMGLATGASIEARLRRVEFIAERLQRFRKRLLGKTGLTDTQLNESIGRPDVGEVLATARERFLLARFEKRMNEFAGILAGQIKGCPEDMDENLVMARASLDMPDEALLLMKVFSQHPEGESCSVRAVETEELCLRDPWALARAVDYLQSVGLCMEGMGREEMFYWTPKGKLANSGQLNLSVKGNVLTPLGWRFIERALEVAPLAAEHRKVARRR